MNQTMDQSLKPIHYHKLKNPNGEDWIYSTFDFRHLHLQNFVFLFKKMKPKVALPVFSCSSMQRKKTTQGRKGSGGGRVQKELKEGLANFQDSSRKTLETQSRHCSNPDDLAELHRTCSSPKHFYILGFELNQLRPNTNWSS